MMQTEWSQFVGRFHPLLVHLPIGFVLFAALLSVIAIFKKNYRLNTAINLALLTGAISATGSSLSGYFLSSAGGYNPEVLVWHKWIGIILTILCFLAWFVRRKQQLDKPFLRLTTSNWILWICVILITVGGHLGGKMTHGEGYFTRYMPGFLKTVFGSKKQPQRKKELPVLDSVNVYADIVQPIFKNHCVSCHNVTKGKGELNLETTDGIMKGGNSGKTVVPGDVDKSELFRRITLPQHSSKFMPAEGRPPLSPIEIHFIRQWIADGADSKKNITASGSDEKTKFLIAAYLGIDAETNKEIKLPGVIPGDSATIQELRAAKLIIRPLTSQSNLLEVSFVMLQEKPVTEILPLLQKLSLLQKQLYRLDVNNCGLTKECMQVIAGYSELNKLEMQGNRLDDDAVRSLEKLQKLEILNAGQNQLTDRSIETFKKMPGLKRLNLWQTKVTDEGQKNLRVYLNELVTP